MILVVIIHSKTFLWTTLLPTLVYCLYSEVHFPRSVVINPLNLYSAGKDF